MGGCVPAVSFFLRSWKLDTRRLIRLQGICFRRRFAQARFPTRSYLPQQHGQRLLICPWWLTERKRGGFTPQCDISFLRHKGQQGGGNGQEDYSKI